MNDLREPAARELGVSHGLRDIGSLILSWKQHLCEELDTWFEAEDPICLCRNWILYGSNRMSGINPVEREKLYWDIKKTRAPSTWRVGFLFAMILFLYLAAQFEMDTQFILQSGYWSCCGRILFECSVSLAMAAASTFAYDFAGSAISILMPCVAKKASIAVRALAGRVSDDIDIDIDTDTDDSTEDSPRGQVDLPKIVVRWLHYVTCIWAIVAQLGAGRVLTSVARDAGSIGRFAVSLVPVDLSRVTAAFPSLCAVEVGAMAIRSGRSRFVCISLVFIAMSASHPCFTDIHNLPPSFDEYEGDNVGAWICEIGLHLVLQLGLAALLYVCGLLMFATLHEWGILVGVLYKRWRRAIRGNGKAEDLEDLEDRMHTLDRRINWLGVGWAVSRALALHLVEMTAHQATYIMFSEFARILFLSTPQTTTDIWLNSHLHSILLAEAIFSGQRVAHIGLLPVAALLAPVLAVAVYWVFLCACRGLVHLGYGHAKWCLTWWTRWTPDAIEADKACPYKSILEMDMALYDIEDRLCFPYLLGGMQWRPYRRYFHWKS